MIEITDENKDERINRYRTLYDRKILRAISSSLSTSFRRENGYRRTPVNVCRHIVLSESNEIRGFLPNVSRRRNVHSFDENILLSAGFGKWSNVLQFRSVSSEELARWFPTPRTVNSSRSSLLLIFFFSSARLYKSTARTTRSEWLFVRYYRISISKYDENFDSKRLNSLVFVEIFSFQPVGKVLLQRQRQRTIRMRLVCYKRCKRVFAISFRTLDKRIPLMTTLIRVRDFDEQNEDQNGEFD